MVKMVKLNYSAFQAYRRNEGSKAAIGEARKLTARANAMGSPTHAGQPMYTALGPQPSPEGATALVHTENTAARVDNAAHNTLAKALGGGG